MDHGFGYFEEDKIGRVADWGLWRRIWGFIAPHWGFGISAVGLSFLVSGAGLVIPQLTRVAIDDYILAQAVTQADRFAGLTRLALWFSLVLAVGFAANFLQIAILERTGQRIMHALRQTLFEHMLKLRAAFFNVHPVGKLVTRLTNDIQNMNEMFTSVVVTLFNAAIKMAGILAVLFWMNPRLAFILSLSLPMVLLLTMLFSRFARDAFRVIRTRLARINSFLQESVAGMSVIQLFSREEDTRRKFSNLTQSYLDANLHQIHVFGIFFPLIEVLSSLTLAVIVWYGGGEVLRERLTLGELTAFISYMRQLFQPVRELSQKFSVVQSALASAERLFEILDNRMVTPAPAGALAPDAIQGDLKFEKLTFGYDPKRPVVRDISFHAAPGQTIAVVGPTGAGKTTLISLLERFHDPDAGAILLDGVSIDRYDLNWLRRKVGLVMQDVFILPGTMRENIMLDADLPEERLNEIVRLSRMDHVAARHHKGLETRIGEGGVTLSAGERQLLAFARVLARDPRILVLDEATASVDSETEVMIEHAIENALAGRTSIVIAHRLSTVRRADRILVMDGGRIKESGTHEQLLEQGGFYTYLHNLQTLDNGRNGHRNGKAVDSP